jgi:hypothetical protein
VDRPVVDRAKAIVLGTDRLSAPETPSTWPSSGSKASSRIASFDAGFDRLAGIERLTA